MNKQELFLITETGSKSRIRANMRLVDLETAINHIKENKYGDLRYCEVNKYVYLLNEISLNQYEIMFKDAGFTESQVTKNFSKEISLVYGEHKTKSLMKRLSSKDIVKGGIYANEHNEMFLYLGKVSYEKVYDKKYGEDSSRYNEFKEGYGFVNLYNKIDILCLEDYRILGCKVLKSYPKLVSKVSQYNGDIPELTSKYYDRRYGTNYTSSIKLLK